MMGLLYPCLMAVEMAVENSSEAETIVFSSSAKATHWPAYLGWRWLQLMSVFILRSIAWRTKRAGTLLRPVEV